MVSHVLVRQEWWGGLIAGYLFLGGLAGVALPIAYYYWIRERNRALSLVGGMASFLAMAAGMVLLVADLGRPEHVAALAPTNPTLNWGSWMTLGTYIIVSYTALTGLYTLHFIPQTGLLRRRGLRPFIDTLGGLASALGLATAAYTGFLLAASRGVQFWNTPLLPVLFVASGASSALCFYCAIAAPLIYWLKPGLREASARVRLQLQMLDAAVTIGELFLLFAYLNVSLSGLPGARESAMIIVQGELAPVFWLGVVGVGMFFPLAVLLGYTLRRHGETPRILVASAIAGWATLIGALLLRYVILAAGMVPVPLA